MERRVGPEDTGFVDLVVVVVVAVEAVVGAGEDSFRLFDGLGAAPEEGAAFEGLLGEGFAFSASFACLADRL